MRLWLRFAGLLVGVVAIGFALGLYVLPHSLGWFVGALILAGLDVLLLASNVISTPWSAKGCDKSRA
jgi:hypothetical protein